MKNYEDKIWLFPLIGGLIVFIAFFSPAMWFDGNVYRTSSSYLYIWIWGLYTIYIPGYAPTISIDINLFILIPSIAVSFIVILMIRGIIKTSFHVWRGDRKLLEVKAIWKKQLITVIIAAITWIVLMEVGTLLSSNLNISFWSGTQVGFGLIGLFLGPAIMIIGLLLIEVMLKNKGTGAFFKEKTPKKIETVVKSGEIKWLGFKLEKVPAIILAFVSVIIMIVCLVVNCFMIYSILYEMYFNPVFTLYPHAIFIIVLLFIINNIFLIFAIYTMQKCRKVQKQLVKAEKTPIS